MISYCTIWPLWRYYQKLDPNKPHGHDTISIRMLKLCGDSIWKPLEIILKNSTKEGIFPDEQKKASTIPIKKEWQTNLI